MTTALMVLGGMYLIFLSLFTLAVVRAVVEDVRDDNSIK
mgnify:FL=1